MNTYTLKGLYALSAKGKVQVWDIRVEGSTIIVNYGTLGGKIQERKTVCTGKNIGRVNETTPEQQAQLEAIAKWNKQKDRRGYSVDIPSEGSNRLIQPFSKPMLAQPIGKRKKPLPERVWSQSKLNGHRCLAMRDKQGVVRLWSRGLKEITTMEHIRSYLQEHLLDGWMLDGELYRHGLSLQDITSRVKRYQEDLSEEIQLHVFDAACEFKPNTRFPYRFYKAYDVLHKDRCKIIQWVAPWEISSTEVGEKHWVFRVQGYEGAIVRTDEEPYKPGYRSQSVLKVKQFHDTEFVVRDITKGIPHEGMDVAILHFDNFKCTGPGTREFKDYVANNPEQFIGRKVTVQYAELTPKGVPFHPVALCFREDI